MSFLKKVFYIFLPIVLGFVTSLIVNFDSFYSDLDKPLLSPPGLLFPIVWGIIYLLMGISYYIYKKDFAEFGKVNFLYYLQLFVNVFWSIIFFGFKLKFFAIIWIIFLDICVILLLLSFYKEKKISFYLNIPYLIWILFATYLTIGIYILN